MTAPKRRIKAKPFLRDLRNGMGDRELMGKYTLSESQLQRVFQKLADAGAIDEMEVFMRTSLSDTTVSKAFMGFQRPGKGAGDPQETTPSSDLDAPSITITERIGNLGKAFSGFVSKVSGADS
jgi:hypothetical protein